MSSEILTATVEGRIGREISLMQEVLGDHADTGAFLALKDWTRSTLGRIGDLIDEGHICPAAADRQRGGAARALRGGHSLRLGVFPTAGNPLHWGHLLGGLAAMERFRLDKVVYIIAGKDPRKPTLASENIRHRIVNDMLSVFHPLLEYSSLALGTTKPGEVSVFRIFAACDAQPLHVFYLAGSDHAHRFSPRSGCPDTIQRLESGVLRRTGGFDPRMHKLSAVFLDRGDRCDPVESLLDVRRIDHLPARTSSTMIRGALNGQKPLCELMALPFTVYRAIRAHDMYRMAQEDAGHRPPGRDFFRRAADAQDHSGEPGDQGVWSRAPA